MASPPWFSRGAAASSSSSSSMAASSSNDGGQYNWWPPFNSSDYTNWPPFPGAVSGDRGDGGAAGIGAGTIVLVAVLVTGFSLLALLLLRLWFCGCSNDEDARGRAAEAAAAAAAKPAQVGLKKDVIDSFQVLSYSSLLVVRGSTEECCAVCISEFNDQDKRIRVMPGCAHCFHPECVDVWLGSHTSCPVCRQDLLQPLPPRSPLPLRSPPTPPPRRSPPQPPQPLAQSHVAIDMIQQ